MSLARSEGVRSLAPDVLEGLPGGTVLLAHWPDGSQKDIYVVLSDADGGASAAGVNILGRDLRASVLSWGCDLTVASTPTNQAARPSVSQVEAAASALCDGDMYEYPYTDSDRERLRSKAREVLVAAALNEAAFEGVEFDRALRAAKYIHQWFVVARRRVAVEAGGPPSGQAARSELAAAWRQGRESVALDLMKAPDEAGMRPVSANPYEK